MIIEDNLNRWLNSDAINNGDTLRSNDEQLLKLEIEHGESIMHDWERPIMELDAKLVTQNGGSILNVGHGMGIIDGYIRSYNPEKHTIIEIHPQIAETARSNGYNVLEGDWIGIVNNFIKNGTKFDGIYFDTYSFDRPDWTLFTDKVSMILNPGGIYCYFNGGAARSQGVDVILKSKNWYSETHEVEVKRKKVIEGKEVSKAYTHSCIFWKKHK